jgi:HAD superfamily hydrolase (TIGR01509 family)
LFHAGIIKYQRNNKVSDTGNTPQTLRAKSYWIFDLDGTLTIPMHDFAYIRQELEIPADADILGHLEQLPAAEATRRQARLQEIELELARKALPSAGALEMIARLHDTGACLGILTRNDRDIALLTLDTIGARHYFADEHVLGRSDALPKPDPDGIHHLLSSWGADPAETVMVGDYLFDLQAGRAAGATTIHVSRPDGKCWPEVTDLAVLDLAELAAHLA